MFYARFTFLSRAVLLAAIACQFTFGQASSPVPATPKHPDFSGRWRMDKEQSEFQKFKQPDIITRTVEQHGNTMNVHTVQTTGKNTTTSDVTYFTDGAESQNVLSGRDAHSKAYWDGEALMIRTITKDSKNDNIEILDRWELSPDGQELVNTSEIGTPDGGARLKLVCKKEPVG
jgi:hypothetical protein